MRLMDRVIIIGIRCEARTWGQGMLGRSPTGLVYSSDNSSGLAGNTEERFE